MGGRIIHSLAPHRSRSVALQSTAPHLPRVGLLGSDCVGEYGSRRTWGMFWCASRRNERNSEISYTSGLLITTRLECSILRSFLL
ncbi:unnamed protein product [Larinioides sclopetarius]|uniref:Uncharacterized protein n=1 Tax=Larinioides sclopetarius TaxID=280406 RepID=A0AAV1Z9D5_9ARAC